MNTFMKLMVVFTLMSILWATPTQAKITEIDTECDIFECYSIFSIDRDLTTIKDYSYKILGDSKVGDKRSFEHGEFVIHQGSIKGLQIEILKDNLIRVSGQIGGGTKNNWGFELLGDKSHLHSSWWNSDFDLCMNWTITESNGTNRIMQPVIFNATGLANKTADSRDFRIVNAACVNLGTEQQYEILSNTSDSVYFAAFINASANATTYYSFYWSNNTPVTAADNRNLFLYANNGSSWVSGGGTAPAIVVSNSEYSVVTTSASNKANYTLLESDHSTGKWWFSYDFNIATADVNGVGFSIGDDYIGGGDAGYQSWLGFIYTAGTTLKCDYVGGSNTLATGVPTNRWYTIKSNLTLPLAPTTGIKVTQNDNNAWSDCGGYNPDYDSMHQLRFFGSGGSLKIKNIFVSNISFNAYNKPLAFATSGTVTKPPAKVDYRAELVNPTPDNNAAHGFDYNIIINISGVVNGTAISSFNLDWGGTNISKDDMGGYAAYDNDDLDITAGKVYNYVGWVVTDSGSNSTEARTLIVSTFTSDELDNQIGLDDFMLFLFLLLVGILVFIIFFR